MLNRNPAAYWKLADTMTEQKNTSLPKLTLRTRLAIVGAFVVVGFVGLYFGSPLQRYRSQEENACHEKCAKMQRSSRLVSPYSQDTRRYDGPWKCECY